MNQMCDPAKSGLFQAGRAPGAEIADHGRHQLVGLIGSPLEEWENGLAQAPGERRYRRGIPDRAQKRRFHVGGQPGQLGIGIDHLHDGNAAPDCDPFRQGFDPQRQMAAMGVQYAQPARSIKRLPVQGGELLGLIDVGHRNGLRQVVLQEHLQAEKHHLRLVGMAARRDVARDRPCALGILQVMPQLVAVGVQNGILVVHRAASGDLLSGSNPARAGLALAKSCTRHPLGRQGKTSQLWLMLC